MRLVFFSSAVVPTVTCFFFFFNDTATTEIYTLSLHDALPISVRRVLGRPRAPFVFTVFGHEQPAPQGVVVWREPNAVRVPVPPRDGLDRVLRVLRVQPRSDRKSTRLNSSTSLSRMPSSA